VALGSAWRSSILVRIPDALAVDLALLTAALDEPTADVGATLSQLMSGAAVAVPSYVGLSVRMSGPDNTTEVTTLEHAGQAEQVRTSMRFSLPGISTAGVLEEANTCTVDIVLCASQPGAFVDLAADLAWLTARPLASFVLDADRPELHRPRTAALSVRTLSSVNQALGVLIGQGATPDEASAQLDARAAALGVERQRAAGQILAAVGPRRWDLEPDESAGPRSS
jgi:hypothetical protein